MVPRALNVGWSGSPLEESPICAILGNRFVINRDTNHSLAKSMHLQLSHFSNFCLVLGGQVSPIVVVVVVVVKDGVVTGGAFGRRSRFGLALLRQMQNTKHKTQNKIRGPTGIGRYDSVILQVVSCSYRIFKRPPTYKNSLGIIYGSNNRFQTPYDSILVSRTNYRYNTDTCL